MYGLKVDWIGRILLQLLPQLHELIINCSRRWIVVVGVSPNLVQQFLAADHTFRIRKKKLQDLEFLRRQRDVLAGARELHLFEVDSDVAKAGGGALRPAPYATHRRLNARQQLPRTERLRNIVICAK